jgi:hypothetical protein
MDKNRRLEKKMVHSKPAVITGTLPAILLTCISGFKTDRALVLLQRPGLRETLYGASQDCRIKDNGKYGMSFAVDSGFTGYFVRLSNTAGATAPGQTMRYEGTVFPHSYCIDENFWKKK